MLRLSILLLLPFSACAALDAAHQWAQWRGPTGNGVAPYADPPTTWSETENVVWKVELPGLGHSSPVVWGERLFLTTAESYGEQVPPPVGIRPGWHDNMPTVKRQRYAVLCVNRADGKILWKKQVRDDVPHEGAHESASFASNSPVTDGTRVYASFGSNGIFCLDFDGNILWQSDLGKMHSLHGHGEGNSPALAGDLLIVNWDQEGPSFIVAFDTATGKERWRTERHEVTSWSTPLVVDVDGTKQVIVSATNRIRGYDARTGVELWSCGGMSTNVVASPVSSDGILYAGSSYEKRSMLALRLAGAHGDVTGNKQVLWTRSHDTPYVPSPLLYDDKLYFLKHYQGILFCLRAQSGEGLYGPLRLPEVFNCYASLVGAGGRVYVTSREGTTCVLRHGDTPQILATNKLDDTFSASPALVDTDLFLRGAKYLYRIGKK